MHKAQNTDSEQQRAKHFQEFLRFVTRVRAPRPETPELVIQFLAERKVKNSYRLNILINIITCLERNKIQIRNHWKIKKVFTAIKVLMLREKPRKAIKVTKEEMTALTNCDYPSLAVPLSLMIPTGMRFADAARILPQDIHEVAKNPSTITMRIYQAKNIRERLHQRWLSMVIPRRLFLHLLLRLRRCKPDEPIINVTYAQFLRMLKRYLKNKRVSTYSIRIFVLNEIADRVDTIEELQAITFHRNANQLRWYLDHQLKDERTLQTRYTAWHLKK